MQDWNENRKRYFGIRVWDKVRTTFPNWVTWEGIVETLCSPDESHIEVQFPSHTSSTRFADEKWSARMPADLFQIVEKVEDLNEKWI